MSLTILLLLLFSVLLLIYGLRNRYCLLFALLVISMTASMLMLMTDVARNSNYLVPANYLIRPVETRLYEMSRGLMHIPLSTQMVIRNGGITAYFVGIVFFVLSFSGSVRLDEGSIRGRPGQYVFLIALPLMFFVFYHPQTAYLFFLRHHASGAPSAAETLLRALDAGMTGCVAACLLWPVVFLLVNYRRGRMTFLSDFLLRMAVPLMVLNISFFLLFFTGIFRPSCDDVLRCGFWRFSMPVQMPAFYTTVLPFVSFILLVAMFVSLLQLHADYVLSFFKFRGIRRNLNSLYANVRNVMHSEKNLLFTVRILADEALAAEDGEARRQALERIRSLCSQNMDDLTRTLRDAHEMNLNTMRSDFIGAVESAVEQQHIPAGVRITRAFPGDSLPLIFDMYHMTHAISNILSNSLEALAASGREDPQIVITVYSSRRWVYFSVWDNGCGIPKKLLHKVEQPHVSTKNKKNSWGIGLSYVFSVVRAHYGQMHITSRQDEYTRVEILLPCTRRKKMIRILLADDNAEIRRYFRTILDREPDLEVVGEAESGRMCVDLARICRPDIILMDIQMETETAGIDAAAVIHETMPECKIIILTIHSDDEMLFRAYSSGVMDFIVKTDSIAKIVSSIQNVSRNQMQLRSDVASKIVSEFQRVRSERASLLYTLNILTKLTNSEFEVLCCIYNGESNREVARTRFVSEATIKSQVNSILKKFGKKRMKDVIAVLDQIGFSQLSALIQKR